MLTLMNDTESWREALVADIDRAEYETGTDNDVTVYNELADVLCCDVLGLLDAAGASVGDVVKI